MKPLLFLLLLITTTFSKYSSVFAEPNKNKLNFTISPPFSEIVLDKNDQQKSFPLIITNNNQNSATFKLSVADFGSLEESAGVAFLGMQKSQLDNKYSLASWISLEKDTIVIGSQQSLPVNVTIINKESLSPGGHYGAILIKYEGSNKQNNDSVSINQSYASLIFAKKVGGEIYKLILSEIIIENNFFIMPHTIRLRFQNSGNVHSVPRGTIEITDPLHRLVAKGIINSESSIIIPESFRVIPNKLNKISYPILPGRYQVKVNYRYDGREISSSSQTSFLYLGSLFWLIITGLLLLFAFLFLKQKKLRRRK